MSRVDVVGLLGLALIGAGLWIYRPWIALVVVGALLLAGAVLTGRARARREEGQ